VSGFRLDVPSEFSSQQSHHYLSLFVVGKLEWPAMIAAYI